MAEIHPFYHVKLICSIISSKKQYFEKGENKLKILYGEIDAESPLFPFQLTDYYEKQMGTNLKRKFISFSNLINPEQLSEIKIQTNKLEEEIRKEYSSNLRIINLDPGYLKESALIMATAKDFSHRIPLKNGIYGHLEFLFGKNKVRLLDWTYPDFKSRDYQNFFIHVRNLYLTTKRTESKEAGSSG
ncbi:MAG: DUF4416 family protein [Candidatus Aminicenantaceae bacterium]